VREGVGLLIYAPRPLIPLKDNIPTSRFPIVTILLIVANVAVFGWQLTFSNDSSPDAELRELGITDADLNAIEYGAMPYRVLHGGGECAVGAVPRDARRARTDIVCEGTPAYREAKELSDQGVAPLVPVATAAWWLTILTSMFMHGGIFHIVGNMLFLWVFGNNIEDSMGRLRFLLFYLAAGTVAIFSESLLETSSTIPTIGASGAVSGVLGGYILLHPRARILTMVIIVFFFTFIEIPALIMLGIWFGLQALPVFGELATPDVGGADGGIAYLAHVGGFLFGLATIKLWANRYEGPTGSSPPSPAPAPAA
jgi:membrane associated rhomboid family serine protease